MHRALHLRLSSACAKPDAPLHFWEGSRNDRRLFCKISHSELSQCEVDYTPSPPPPHTFRISRPHPHAAVVGFRTTLKRPCPMCAFKCHTGTPMCMLKCHVGATPTGCLPAVRAIVMSKGCMLGASVVLPPPMPRPCPLLYPRVHWKGGRSPPPLQGAQPMPSHCLLECQLLWHL